jgi:hypothetical protein
LKEPQFIRGLIVLYCTEADHNGYGYFYGPSTLGRNNPEHPIIEKIIADNEPIERLLPKGFADKKRWLPVKLQNIT